MTSPTSDDDEGLDAPEALYRSLIAADPDSALPRFSLARLCLESGRHPEAAEHLRFCVGKTADWAAAWMLLGDALVGADDAPGAKLAYGQARAASVAQHHQSLVDEADEKLAAL